MYHVGNDVCKSLVSWIEIVEESIIFLHVFFKTFFFHLNH